MKQHFAIFCLLAALSLGGLWGIHRSVGGTAQALAFREEPQLGDLSAAQGLTVSTQATLQDQLFWDFSMTPEGQTSAEVRFSKQPERQDQGGKPYFELYTLTQSSASTSGTFDLEGPEAVPWMAGAYRELAESIQPNGTSTGDFLVTDYMETYPASFTLRTPFANYHWDAANPDWVNHTDAFSTQLQQAFTFPVLEGHRQQLQVQANDQGQVVAYGSTDLEGSGVSIYSQSFASPDSLFFVVEARAERDDSLLDYSHTPGGYGVYRLPMDREELTMEDLELVYTLDPTEHILDFTFYPDTNCLLQAVSQEDRFFLRTVDLTTGETLQILPLPDRDPEHRFLQLFQSNGLTLVADSHTQALLLQPDDRGGFTPLLTFPLPDQDTYSELLLQPLALAWDGQRLALASQAFTPQEGYAYSGGFNTSFSLFLFDETGPLYAGTLRNSLDAGIGQVQFSQDLCRLTGDPLLTLQWKEAAP